MAGVQLPTAAGSRGCELLAPVTATRSPEVKPTWKGKNNSAKRQLWFYCLSSLCFFSPRFRPFMCSERAQLHAVSNPDTSVSFFADVRCAQKQVKPRFRPPPFCASARAHH